VKTVLSFQARSHRALAAGAFSRGKSCPDIIPNGLFVLERNVPVPSFRFVDLPWLLCPTRAFKWTQPLRRAEAAYPVPTSSIVDRSLPCANPLTSFYRMLRSFRNVLPLPHATSGSLKISLPLSLFFGPRAGTSSSRLRDEISGVITLLIHRVRPIRGLRSPAPLSCISKEFSAYRETSSFCSAGSSRSFLMLLKLKALFHCSSLGYTCTFFMGLIQLRVVQRHSLFFSPP